MRRCTIFSLSPLFALVLLGCSGLLLGALGCAPSPPATSVPGTPAGAETPAVSTAAADTAQTPEAAPESGNTTGLPTRPGDELVEVSGKVQKVGDFGWGLVPDADPGTRYAPDNLADEFHEDGLRVVFSGVLGEIPPGARLWGTPLHLTAIRRLND